MRMEESLEIEAKVTTCIYMYTVPLPLTSHCAGTTGEHIVLVGDSAGGNLAVATAMKSLECGGYTINVYIHCTLYIIQTPTITI